MGMTSTLTQLREKPGKPPWFTTKRMKGQSPISALTLNQAFPYEKPQAERLKPQTFTLGFFTDSIREFANARANHSDNQPLLADRD
jgi:hypothetical protein